LVRGIRKNKIRRLNQIKNINILESKIRRSPLAPWPFNIEDEKILPSLHRYRIYVDRDKDAVRFAEFREHNLNERAKRLAVLIL